VTPGRSLNNWWRGLAGPQRVLTIATAILAVPLFGQLVSLKDLTTTGHSSALAFLLMALSVFVLPTTIILIAVIAATAWPKRLEHRALLAVCAADLLVVALILWYFFDPCGWMHVFGLVARECK
jgi:hypothetical protein